MDSFILYVEWERHFAILSPAQQGALIMALFAYQDRGEMPDGSDPGMAMAFSFIRTAMDKNAQAWEETRRGRAEAGRAGGLARASKTKQSQANASKAGKGKQGQADQSNQAVYVSVSDSVSVSIPPSEGGEKRAGEPRFTPPTLAQVAAYVREIGSPVEPQEFIDFYAAKGWLVGKTPMKDWKAACRNAGRWDRWSRPTASERPPRPAGRPSFSELAAQMQQEGEP